MTSDEDRAALREKVARAIADYELPIGPGWQDRWRDYLGTADAAIAVCMEEVAKVAETPCPITPHPRECERCCGSGLVYRWPRDIAAAIRGLITSPESAAPDADQSPATR